MPKTTKRSANPCKHCGGTNHQSFKCFKNPRRIEQMAKKRSRSNYNQQWLEVRAKWFKDSGLENYSCFYCGVFLLKNQVELDHFHSRSRRPDLRFDLSNLVPSCHRCNTDKGSRSGDEYREIMQKMPQTD